MENSRYNSQNCIFYAKPFTKALHSWLREGGVWISLGRAEKITPASHDKFRAVSHQTEKHVSQKEWNKWDLL